MSEKTYGTIVTNVGNRLIIDAMMEGEKVNLTTLAVGDGGGAYYQPTPDMTGLKNQKWSGPVGSVTINEASPNMIDIVAVVPSNVGGFTIREMSIMTPDGDTFAICNTPDTEKVVITTGAAGEIELQMHVELSNTDAITFVIDPNVIQATKKDIEQHNTSPTAHAALFERKAEASEVSAHIHNTDVHVNPTTMGNYDTAISGLIEHTENAAIHTSDTERTRWNLGAETASAASAAASQALNRVADIESRMARVEDGLFNNITGNPFLVSFDSLDGITLVKGIWNRERQRIEC